MRNLFFVPALFLSLASSAAPVEFHIVDSDRGFRCVNDKDQDGFNAGYLGECGQVSAQEFKSVDARSLFLYGTQAVGTTFRQVDLSGSNVRWANFQKAFFDDGARLESIHISYSDFSDAFLPQLSLALLNVYQSNLQRVNAFKVIGPQMELSSVDATGADFSFSSLPQLLCESCTFVSAKLDRASWRDSLISNSEFSKAMMGDMVLSGSMIGNSKFDDAVMYDVNVDGAQLGALSFLRTQLINADFVGARIENCDFSGADLRGANFSSVALSGTNLWKGAKYNSSTKLPFSEDQAAKEGMIKVPDSGSLLP